jgi:hypothetical protein
MTRTYIDLILKSDGLEKLPQLLSPAKEKVYKRKDFSEEAVKRLYDRFESGLVADYLADLPKRVDRYPILRQPGL